MRDGSDGAALLAVVHYYCPEQMKLDGEWRMRSLNRPERDQCAFNMQEKPREVAGVPVPVGILPHAGDSERPNTSS